LEAELTELGKIAGEHGSTHAAFMSQMKLGELYESENKSDLAIQSYTGALKHADTMLFKVIAHYNLGHAYEAQGATNKEAYQQAIAQYEKITEFNKTRLLFWEFGDRPISFG
jgi:tetratricopeptide (TPR) repeat protein